MQHFGRRAFVTGVALLPPLLLAGRADATLMRGLSLRRLSAQSQHVLLLTGLQAHCVSISIAGRPAIITETRVRVEDVYAKATPNSGELVVRTLGGVLGGEGELVHGQAELALGVQCLVFLTRAEDESLWVTGMAQGHYPIAAPVSSEALLVASPHLPTLRDFEHSAVRALVGQKLTQARRLIEDSAR